MPNGSRGEYPRDLPSRQMGNGRISIVIAEGNALLAQALEGLFREAAPDASIDLAATVPDTLAAVRSHQPDLVLIDSWMDRSDAEVCVHQVLQRSPGSTVVVFATTVDSAFADAMGRAGAADCVEKDSLGTAAQAILGLVEAAR